MRPTSRLIADLGTVSILLTLLQTSPAAAQLAPRINEAMSINANGLVDAYGSTADWIELHNPGSTPVDLAGWGLSDELDAPLAWVFPGGTTLAADEYLVVFASGDVSVAGEVHVSFSLSGSGETLFLARPDGVVVSDMVLPQMLPDYSFGIGANGAAQIFSTPTPGAPNAGGALGLLADPQVSPERGFFDSPQLIALGHDDPQATIRFTTDGSAPTAASGTVYQAPFTVNATTTLRAAAFRSGFITGKPVTHTYVFAQDVPLQPTMYAPRVDSAAKRQLVVDGLHAQPAISIVTDQSINLADRVATSVEWIDPSGGAGFQVDAGIQEVGGTSVRYPKDSWRLAFDSVWGESELEFPVFGDFPSQGTIQPVDEFKRLTLRSGSHDTLLWENDSFNFRGTWIRSRWGDETMLELGHVNAHGRWVNVFLNGVYTGQYHLREHFDDHFMASYFGGDNDSYIGVNRAVVSNGAGDAWDSAIVAAGSWASWSQWVDPIAYIDWMLINEYQGNFWDLRISQNWRAAGQSSALSSYPGFIFLGSDQDITFAVADAATGFPGPANSWTNVISEKDPEFLALLNDRVQALLRGDGALTTAASTDRWNRMASQIDSSVYGEIARWGHLRPGQTHAKWVGDVASLGAVEIAARQNFTLTRLANMGVIAPTQAPMISDQPVPHGSIVPIENPNGTGLVLVTFDGTDPRLPGGAPAPGAAALSQIVVDQSLQVTARAWVGGEWSPLVTVDLTPTFDPNAPVIAASRDLVTVEGFGVAHLIGASDPNGAALSFSEEDLPSGLSIDEQTGVISGVPTSTGVATVLVTVTNDERSASTLFEWEVVAHGGPSDIAVVLNEYNAVKSSEVLSDGGADATFGTVVGNGGDWLELVVTKDNTDLRGWSVELWDRENGPLEHRDTIVFRDAPVLANLMAGTIITIAESQAEDTSYDPIAEDWTINARSSTGFASSIVTADAGNFDSNRHSFRVRLRDASGTSQSPFMGETEMLRSFLNVGGTEVFARCDTPTPDMYPVDGDARDLPNSSFGVPNDCGDVEQEFGSLRGELQGDANCDGSISEADALTINRYIVGLASPAGSCGAWSLGQVHLKNADVDGDGETSVSDALQISQCVAGDGCG